MLDIRNLTFRIGGRVLFDAASLQVASGQRVGLVGRNGAGKSTLFKLILGELHPDGGSVELSSRLRIGSVAQEPPDGPMSLVDWVVDQDRERAALMATGRHRRQSPAASPTPMSGWWPSTPTRRRRGRRRSWPVSASRPSARQQPVAEFSGGWRMRVALAGALFARPDLLLLDEPTNHLDLEATIWLQNYLQSFPGTLIVISHDREILNAVPERIVHLERGKLVAYGGNYDRFEQVRREKIELLAKSRGQAGGAAQAPAGLRRPFPRQGEPRRPRRRAGSRCSSASARRSR